MCVDVVRLLSGGGGGSRISLLNVDVVTGYDSSSQNVPPDLPPHALAATSLWRTLRDVPSMSGGRLWRSHAVGQGTRF